MFFASSFRSFRASPRSPFVKQHFDTLNMCKRITIITALLLAQAEHVTALGVGAVTNREVHNARTRNVCAAKTKSSGRVDVWRSLCMIRRAILTMKMHSDLQCLLPRQAVVVCSVVMRAGMRSAYTTVHCHMHVPNGILACAHLAHVRKTGRASERRRRAN